MGSDRVSATAPVEDLRRSLDAIGRILSTWLADLEGVSAGDPRFDAAFRRWEEQLTLLKLHLHRAEQRLLHYLLVPEERRPWRDLPRQREDARGRYRRWHDRLAGWMVALHLPTAYRRLGDVLDLAGEATTADAITDLVALAELAQSTVEALATFAAIDQPDCLEDLAFFHVISPWKQQGMPALFDLLRWLNAFLAERDEL